MKQLQKFSKFLSDYTSIVVIAIAVITFFLPSLMGWVNFQLFTDPVANKFTSQSIIIGVITGERIVDTVVIPTENATSPPQR